MENLLSKYNACDVILVCGLPGTGKSVFSRQYFKQSGRKRINQAEIRHLLFEMTNFGDPWKEEFFHEEDEALVNHVERKLYEHLLFSHQKVLVDNPGLTAAQRKVYIETARKINKTIGAIFLDIEIQQCLLRNHNRPDPIPDSVITNLYASMELPSDSEGFEIVHVVLVK
ncbi:MAG: ATP-binding protein [Spirochaetales bacterium]|nr:ATP-binding protein [Spirochaetales bacterium]